MVCTVFLCLCFVFHPLSRGFFRANVFNSDEVKLVHFSFYGSCFWCRVQEPPVSPRPQRFSPVLLAKHVDASRGVCDFYVRCEVYIKAPHRILTPLAPFTEQAVSCSPQITFVPFSKISWAYLHGFASELPFFAM